MSLLSELFKDFTDTLQTRYLEACADSQIDPLRVPLHFEELSFNTNSYRSEFAAIPCPPQVRITFNGLASLWAFCQAASRIGRVMFETQRSENTTGDAPIIPVTDDVKTGFYFFELSLRLAQDKFEHWVTWVPRPDFAATDRADMEGNLLFFRSISWIMRHELAHHALNHHHNRSSIPEDNQKQEYEADRHATVSIKGGYRADLQRKLGSKPESSEVELEKRAIASLLGMIWVAQFELTPHGHSATHPDTSDRIFKIFEVLELRDDSFAAEFISYIIKALVDPEGDWPPCSSEATAYDAAVQAMIKLGRHINTAKQ